MVKMKRIGDGKWIFARRGADWDDADEKLSVGFIKAMAWRVGEDADGYIVMTEMPCGSKYHIRDIEALQMAIRYHRYVVSASGTGGLVLDVILLEQLDDYRADRVDKSCSFGRAGPLLLPRRSGGVGLE